MALVWRYAAKDKAFPTPFWSVTPTLVALGTKTFTQALGSDWLGAMVLDGEDVFNKYLKVTWIVSRGCNRDDVIPIFVGFYETHMTN